MYLVSRAADWIIAPFQCDKCWFINLFDRAPIADSVADTYHLRLIRRANLDLFWSRRAGTVNGTRLSLREIIRRSKTHGTRVPLAQMTPWPLGDDQGMGLAIVMLEKSLKPGRNVDYTQFDSCRKLRSAASNVYAATAQSSSLRYTMKGLKGGHLLHLDEGTTQSFFMERFMTGMKSRMPKHTSRNLPFMGKMVAYVLDVLEAEWSDPNTDPIRRRECLMTAGYMAVTYGYSLRGNEGFWVDCDRLCANIDVGKYHARAPHVCIPVLGRFKAEDGDRMHVFPLANCTRTGVRIRVWLERVVRQLQNEGKHFCPAFCDDEGYMLTSIAIESVFHPILEDMQGMDRFREDIPRNKDVRDYFRTFRSFRRGAENEALAQEVDELIIDFVHRWNRYEQNRGKEPGFNMMEHYASGYANRYNQIFFSASI